MRVWRMNVCWVPLLLCLPGTGLLAQSDSASKIGGAQTSNTHVQPKSGAGAAHADASGSATVVLKHGSGAEPSHVPAALKKDASLPLNDHLPTSPADPVELSDIGLVPYILHRQPAVYPEAARKLKAKGAVVLDIVIDENGKVERAEPIGAPDFSAAAMEALGSWKFTPYRFHGQPWKLSSWVRFTFDNPAKGTSE